MKKIIAVALFSALASGLTLADDAAVKASIPRPEITTLSGHKMAIMEADSDAAHDTCEPREYGMMGESGVDTMMRSNMQTLGTLLLNKEQKSAINNLSDEFEHNIWFIQGLINDEAAKLRFLYEAERRDPAAIGKEYMKVFDLKRQMIETYLDTQNRIEDILTPEQRAKMKDSRHEMHRIYGHPLK